MADEKGFDTVLAIAPDVLESTDSSDACHLVPKHACFVSSIRLN